MESVQPVTGGVSKYVDVMSEYYTLWDQVLLRRQLRAGGQRILLERSLLLQMQIQIRLFTHWTENPEGNRIMGIKNKPNY